MLSVQVTVTVRHSFLPQFVCQSVNNGYVQQKILSCGHNALLLPEGRQDRKRPTQDMVR